METVASIDVTTPDEQEAVDIEVRGRFGFEASAGDYGLISPLLYPEGGPPRPTPLRPDPRGGLRLGEPGLPPEQGEGSQTWFFPSVPAGGRAYELEIVARALDGDGNHAAEVSGSGGSVEVHVRGVAP